MIPNLDASDIKILQLLQEDARLTSKEIALRLGKSLNPVYERIRKLEQQGFIKRYVAILDRSKIDRNLIAYTNVQLKEHAHDMLKHFEATVIKLPEVMECHHMTGVFDYLLKVVVKDMNDYQNFVVKKLSKIPNIGNVQSGFVMNEIKNETKYMFP